jgi:hypothetical protein
MQLTKPAQAMGASQLIRGVRRTAMTSRGGTVVLAALLGGTLAGASGPYLRFPPRHSTDLLSHSVCELPPESERGMFRMPVAAGHRLEFRKWHYYEVVFLVEMKEEEDTCRDRIVATLELPSHGSHEAINFRCSPTDRSPKDGEAFIGIVPDGESGRATPAWRVDVLHKTFSLVKDGAVECEKNGAQ